MTSLIPVGHRQFTNSNGEPLVGGSAGYYEVNGSATTLKPIWADENKAVQLTNPVPLNSAGRPFSGGAEVALWGDGQYTEVVRDSEGTIVYTAVIDTPLSTAGGNLDITGNLNVSGTISAGGNINAGGSFNTPNAINAGSANITGQMSSNSVTTNGITDNGNLSVGGNTNIGGHLTVGNGADISNGATIDSGNLNLNGNNIDNVGTLNANVVNANQINTGTSPAPSIKAQGGGIGVPAGSAVNVNFSTPFNTVIGVAATVEGIASEAVAATIISYNNSGMTLSSYAPQAGLVIGVFWMAVGT